MAIRTVEAGKMVYIPSDVTLHKTKTKNHNENYWTNVYKTKAPRNGVVVEEVSDGRCKIFYDGEIWCAMKRDLYPVQ